MAEKVKKPDENTRRIMRERNEADMEAYAKLYGWDKKSNAGAKAKKKPVAKKQSGK